MRQRKPRAGWEGHPRAAQRQPGPWMSGRILDLADPVELPELARVQPHKLVASWALSTPRKLGNWLITM